MNTKLYQDIKGKFSAKWRIEPFEVAQATIESIAEVHPQLAEKMSVSSGYKVLNGTDLTAPEAALIEEAIENANSNVVYTCETFAEVEKSAAPALSMPSAAKRTSRINSSDIIVTQETFDKLSKALESNASRITSKPHTYNLETISRLKLESLAFAAKDVNETGSLQEQRFVSEATVKEGRLIDGARGVIAITSPSGTVYPVDEATVVRGPEEDKLLAPHMIRNFNDCPGEATDYRNEIQTLVFNNKEAHISVRPFDKACEIVKEFDESYSHHGASKLRGEIDIWGPLTEQVDKIIETLREQGIKVIAGKGCGSSFQPDSRDDINPLDVSSWKTDK